MQAARTALPLPPPSPQLGCRLARVLRRMLPLHTYTRTLHLQLGYSLAHVLHQPNPAH